MPRQGRTVKDVVPQDFIVALAQHFKKTQKIELPEWHDIVKTSTSRELAPHNPDWYYIRAASIIRKVYLKGGLGLNAFATIYGAGNRQYTHHKHRVHHSPAARGLIRHILQQLEKQGYIAQRENLGGRYITSEGRKELDTIASQLIKQRKNSVYSDIVNGRIV